MHERNFTLDIGDEVKHPCGIGTVRQREKKEDGSEWYLIRYSDRASEWVSVRAIESDCEENCDADETEAAVPEDGLRRDD